jgi:hypothetical protein
MKAKGFVFGLGLVLVGGLAGATAYNSRESAEIEGRMRSALRGGAKAMGSQTVFTSVEVNNSLGREVVALDSDSVNDGIVAVGNRNGDPRAGILVSAQDAGTVAVFNNAGRVTYALDGMGGLIAASGDLAETFPVAAKVPPGSVVVIDAEQQGAMKLATSPYDRRVAGVIAGANNYKSAITLRAMEPTEGRQPVTLTGTAYCLASNANGPIKAGDLLTTSSVPGHAMRVTDHEAARGAILGKALEDLKGDKGHVLILASLQ